MYTLRLLIIIFLMTASNLYAQQREDDKANSVIMSSQANRLIEEGTEKLKPTIKLKVDDGEIAVLPFIICLF